MFSPSGIFVWWPKEKNVTGYLVQFQSDESTAFSNHIVGTTRHIDEFQTWNDISGDLTNIPVTANVYPYTEVQEDNDNDGDETTKSSSIERKKTNPKMITELRVLGNVSGILIPNTHEIVVRVLVPIHDDEGELIQDVRYVEWKKVRVFDGNSIHFSRNILFFLHNLSIQLFLFCFVNNFSDPSNRLKIFQATG